MNRALRGAVRSCGHLACLVVSFAVIVLPALAERPRVYAITGAHVVPAPGEAIESGTIVLRDGLIASVGADIEPPPDAEVIAGDGLWVYPGLIEPSSSLGQRSSSEQESGGPASGGPPGSPSGQRRHESPAGAVHPISRVHPERSARDLLRPFEGDAKHQAERYRDLGFTTALSAPGSGLFRGTSTAILLLDETPVPEMILREGVASHVALERGSFGEGYPTSLMGAAAAFRQVMLDAERFRVWSERYEKKPRGMARPEHVDAFAALAPVLRGEQITFFHVTSAQDVLLAHRLVDELGLEAVVSASGYEWEIADQVARTGHQLLFPVAFPDKPKVSDEDEALDVTLRTLRRYVEAPSAPARLKEAGIRFAFTTDGLKNLADFPKNMRKIIEAGLSEDDALAALTTIPAALLGIDDVTGTLEPGKIANLAVLDGPLFGEDSKIKRVFVDGVEYRTKEKKKPTSDPNAVVDPRGEWSVVFEFGPRTMTRVWTIEREKDAYTGTAETQRGIVEFESVELEGNLMTVVFPAQDDRPATEVSVVITGDTFEGSIELGPRSAPISGTRTRGPEGGAR